MTCFAAALRLLQVNSNKSGGTTEWTRHKNELTHALSALPASEQRSHAQHLVTVMSSCAVMKTPGTWRPFIFCIIEHLSPEKLQEACSSAKMREEAVRTAMANAEKQARSGNLSSKKRALSLVPQSSKEKPSGKRNKGVKMKKEEDEEDEEGKLEGRRMKKEEEEGRGKQDEEGRGQGRIKMKKEEGSLDPTSTSEAAPPSQAPTATHVVTNSSVKAKSGIQRFMVAAAVQPVQPEADGQSMEIHSGTANSSCSDEAAPSDGSSNGQENAHGYYAVLGISVDAGAAQIRQAYRHRVLQTHPDKGGSAEDFLKVVEAFEALSDPSKRAVYDKQKARATVPADWCNEVDQRQLAKNVCAHMFTLPAPAWTTYLKTVDIAVLEVLATELQASANSKDQEPSETSKSTDFSGKGTGLKRTKSGWWVQVSWRNFKITSQFSIKSMEQAVNLHIALTTIRAAAMERWEKHLATLASMDVKQKDVGATGLDNCPVLSASEHLQLLQEEPFVPLLFSSDFPAPKPKPGSKQVPPRLQTNWTSNLDTALEFRSLCRAAQGHDGKIEELKSHMIARAASERAESKKRLDFAAKVVKESISATRSSLPAAPPTPALQETAAAELAENMQAMRHDLQNLTAQMSASQAREISREADFQQQIAQAKHDMQEKHDREKRNMEEQHDQQRQQQREQQKQLLLEEKRRHEDELREERHMHESMQLRIEATEARQQKQNAEDLLSKVFENTVKQPPQRSPGISIARATWMPPSTASLSSELLQQKRRAPITRVSPLEPAGSNNFQNWNYR
mmetsp:Transcript_69558/g.123027  ORF Transcript_69558/g.123027 Transcript_69558/m.123027 type:complete len:793 (-) Transcript_69558:117-2495(-)